MSQQCVDPIVGKILAGWRYDISGLAAEMRGDYEKHFAACERCRSRQQIHRVIDVGLIVLASVSGGVFLLAFGVIRYLGPRHALLLEIAALAGFALSALIWLGVAVATPAPVTDPTLWRVTGRPGIGATARLSLEAPSQPPRRRSALDAAAK